MISSLFNSSFNCFSIISSFLSLSLNDKKIIYILLCSQYLFICHTHFRSQRYRPLKCDIMEKQLNDELKRLEIIEMNEKADNAVAVAVAATAATGAIPIPFADAPLLIGEQVTLMAKIGRAHV